MLCNGYGEHNIQGIGDKHIPLIHNVMNTDAVVAVSDAASDALNLLFRNEVGRRYLTARRKLDPALIRQFELVGISGLANVVGAIKLAKHLDFGPDDVVMTVATDSAALYGSEVERFVARCYHAGFDEVNAGEVFSRHMKGTADDGVLELRHVDRKRIFNLGYYTGLNSKVSRLRTSIAGKTRASGGAWWPTSRAWDLPDPAIQRRGRQQAAA